MLKTQTKAFPQEVKDEIKTVKDEDDDGCGLVIKDMKFIKEDEFAFPSGYDEENFQIWSWNINGIRAILKKNRLQEFFEKANPIIIAIQETKIDDERLVAEHMKDKFPSDYYQYWNSCKPPIKGYAGTAIFTKLKPISAKYDIGVPKHDKEGRTITLEFDKFFLVASYVPNSGATLKWQEYRTDEWDLDFRCYIKSLEQKGKPVVLIGDMNVSHKEIDNFDPKRNENQACFTPEERQSFTNFLSLGFCDTFRELYPGKIKYSFWDIRDKSRRENKGWRLDYAIVSKGLMDHVLDSEIHNEYWGSDHCPISISLNLKAIDLNKFVEYMALDHEEIDQEQKQAPEKLKAGFDDMEEEYKSDLEDFEEENEEKGILNLMGMGGEESYIEEGDYKAEESTPFFEDPDSEQPPCKRQKLS